MSAHHPIGVPMSERADILMGAADFQVLRLIILDVVCFWDFSC